MLNKLVLAILLSLGFIGCASVPKVDPKGLQKQQNIQAGQAAIYVYRSNSILGSALKKDVWLNGECLGETARGVYFYKEVEAGKKHIVSTESEFSPNHLNITTESGKKYYVQQYIKPGVLVGGANIKLVDEVEGKQAIEKYSLAVEGTCSKQSIQF
ncbi:DUF2846 domain-containing protein [uncultured Acinetobacter sp.]|uniref:DUF2846 domain-containing protein n=1 Tax=uncultured Acinetobacter sp. TaxID=165433 RepID=UPI0026311F2A|nr:DUF2846 domain-containing protein [uncultured Acinetobacter sp.]